MIFLLGGEIRKQNYISIESDFEADSATILRETGIRYPTILDYKYDLIYRSTTNKYDLKLKGLGGALDFSGELVS